MQVDRNVTFAFTDIEGSTARWERDRVAMQDAVRRHDAIVQAAIIQHGGEVFKTVGDAFCSAFAAPQDAVAAMLAAQQALNAEDFSAVDGLCVRAAVHTGTAERRENDYFGPALNKVSRLLAIGHGGQVLLTAETAALVDGTLPPNVTLRELGAYHLKDFAEPQRLYQLLAPALPAQFPPLRSLGTLPSDLSVVDTAEFHPVANFSGREEELATLQAALKHDGAIAVLHALGGAGKSSIAREYGWRNRDEYSVVWWLNAQTEDGIIEGLLRLGTIFVHGLAQLADRRVAAERVINSVLGGFHKPVLLVFDNLEDEGLMRTWLPRTGTRALATSRDTAWSADIAAIPVHTWTLETATDYLHRATGRADLRDDDARAIVQAVGALPLALAHAAASLRTARKLTPKRYLERISERLHNAPRGAEYPRSVFATFITAIAQAEHQVAGAAAVLCFAAFFAPDAIPDELFRQESECYSEGLQPTVADGVALDLRAAISSELLLDEALGALDRLSLLSFTQSSQTYSMHRLVQLAAQDLAGTGASAWHECAVCVAEAAFPGQADIASWPQCGRLFAHASAALDTLPEDTAFLPAGRLASRCGFYLHERGQYSAAELFGERGSAILERALGPEHLDVARSLNSLGNVYWNEGHLPEAESIFSRALAIREKALGPDHTDVATSLNNLGIVYHDQGRYTEAERFHQRALAIWEKALGPDHPDVALSLMNLANTYDTQGRFADAERLHKRALTIRENALGPDHPLVAFSLTNLALVYQEKGRYEEAEPLNVRSLAIREKALGPEHSHVAMSLNVLALMCAAQGRYAEAEAHHLRALAIREKTFGPDAPDVAQSLNNLGELYVLQERYAEAESLLARALSIREKTLVPDHVDIARTLNAIGNVYRAQNRYEEAEPALVRALAVREKSLGAEHPWTKDARNALAALRDEIGTEATTIPFR
ncbi:MAG: tetratricopeptide repeat protein [Candidatus Eremiobacteraeota bacterium]|nr:tetratricopeptide repeat protein [Candidatus Eremiobacteraeota bacterium]